MVYRELVFPLMAWAETISILVSRAINCKAILRDLLAKIQ